MQETASFKKDALASKTSSPATAGLCRAPRAAVGFPHAAGGYPQGVLRAHHGQGDQTRRKGAAALPAERGSQPPVQLMKQPFALAGAQVFEGVARQLVAHVRALYLALRNSP